MWRFILALSSLLSNGMQAIWLFVTSRDYRRWLYVRAAIRRGASLAWLDLSHMDLSDMDLADRDFRGANLWRANLRKANLTLSNLTHANLGEADLTGACLVGADLRAAQLIGTKLREAVLITANLSAADMPGADLTDAKLVFTRMNSVRVEPKYHGTVVLVEPLGRLSLCITQTRTYIGAYSHTNCELLADRLGTTDPDIVEWWQTYGAAAKLLIDCVAKA